MYYLDASLAVALFTNEPGTDAAMDWASRNAPLAISAWVTVELRSAVAVKARLGELSEVARQDALHGYLKAARDDFRSLEIDDEVFREAAKIAGNVEAGLRAGDALNLAVAAVHGAKLATRDRRQAEGGAALGITTVLV